MKIRFLMLVLAISFALAFTTQQASAIGAPPLERVPTSSWGIYDIQGSRWDLVQTGEQIQVVADLANGQDIQQSLAYVVEIYDEEKNQVYRSWLDATLNPMDAFSPAISWIPEEPGYYNARIMVWEAIDNPSSLSPSLDAEFYVVDDINGLSENRGCKDGKELIFKINYKKASCVSTETFPKLLDRGWANWHDWYEPFFTDNLRQGVQTIDVVHAEFIKREALKNSKVENYLSGQTDYDFACCVFQYGDGEPPSHYDVVSTFYNLEDDKQVVVIYDLQRTRVIDAIRKDTIHFGGPPPIDPNEMHVRDGPDPGPPHVPTVYDEHYFQDLFASHDLILDGEVIYRSDDRFAEYKIKVHRYFKNDLGLEEITATSDTSKSGFSPGPDVLFYLNQINDTWWDISTSSLPLVNKGCTDAFVVLNMPFNSNNECWSEFYDEELQLLTTKITQSLDMMLRNGQVEEFNNLREKTAGNPLFENMYASDHDLAGINLEGIVLLRADFSNSNLDGANLYGTNLNHANLQGASLKNAIMNSISLDDANLSGVDLSSIKSIYGSLKRTNLQNATLTGVEISSAQMQNANLENADLQNAFFYGNLDAINLKNANLDGAMLARSDLDDAIFTGASLQHANLQGAFMSNADFKNANLQHANLQGADLRNANLENTDLLFANLIDVRNLPISNDEAKLRGAILE